MIAAPFNNDYPACAPMGEEEQSEMARTLFEQLPFASQARLIGKWSEDNRLPEWAVSVDFGRAWKEAE